MSAIIGISDLETLTDLVRDAGSDFARMIGHRRPDVVGANTELLFNLTPLALAYSGGRNVAEGIKEGDVGKGALGAAEVALAAISGAPVARVAAKAAEPLINRLKARVLEFKYPDETAVLGETGPYLVGRPRPRYARQLAEQEGVERLGDRRFDFSNSELNAAENADQFAAAAANDPRVALKVIDKDTARPWSAAERQPSTDALRNSASDQLLSEIFERPITDSNRAYLQANAERLLTAWAAEAKTAAERAKYGDLARRLREKPDVAK